MAKSKEQPTKEGALERASRAYRNFNILGAVALGGLAIVAPVGEAVLLGLAGLNAAQAGVAEIVRHGAKKSRQSKT